MVKKVIDIIPPDRPADRGEEQFSGPAIRPFEEEPVASSEVRPQAKPRITYISRKPDRDPGRRAAEDRSGNVFKGWPLKLAVTFGLVALAMYGIDLKFAKATIKIWPATNPLTGEAKIIVDSGAKEIDKDRKVIPGIAVSVEDTISGDAPATGKKNVQGKAQGTVKIFNNYTASQRLVKGTRLQAPLEKFQPALANDEAPWFRTTEDVVVGPKTSATVNVVADGAGEKYNIDSSVFSVPGLVGTAQYTFIYGQSFEKFQGGTQGAAPEVTANDLTNAKKAITDQANIQFKEKLQAKVPQGFVLLADTAKIELDAPVIPAKVGDSVGKINCQVHGKTAAIAYNKADLDSLGNEFIDSQVPPGEIADETSLRMESSYAGIDPVSGKPSLMLSAQMTTYAGLEETDLKKGLSEKGRKEAEIFLMNQPGMKNVQIRLTPPWRFNIPRDLDRIEVQTILD